MGTHRIRQETEERMLNYISGLYKKGEKYWWDFTFDDAVSELLTEVGF